jgi:hypothetical protein
VNNTDKLDRHTDTSAYRIPSIFGVARESGGLPLFSWELRVKMEYAPGDRNC